MFSHSFSQRLAAVLLPLSTLSLQALAQNIGQWGDPITFPLVPVGAAMIPGTGKLLTWSAYAVDTFGAGVSNITQTAIYNPADGSVQEIPVYVGHDMFCPGVSFDFNGNLVVTGGDTAPMTSVFQSSQQTWQQAAELVIARGYQASATMSDGRVFTIGGSWSGGGGSKDGEVWDGTSWTLYSGCSVSAMLTADPAGIYRADNHGWLFGWQNGSVFQAGPSKAMNWYYPTGSGSYASAGNRGDDGDAMCGPAAMYDAVAGEILAVGGSPAYQDDLATTNAHLITIGAPGSTVAVETLSPMHYPRTFATSTILPDGSIFIVGGQTYGVPFSDANSSLVPELWNPVSKTFTDTAVQGTPRNYHSVAVLMDDATVFSGGGGLCGTGCSTNHFDGEIFSPPYLFEADGTTAASRPVIDAVSGATAKVGSTITATLDSDTPTVSFSLVRYGSSTHTVNTDQRRVPLTPTSANGSTYTLQLPDDPGVLLPGYWFLFALRNGVPSVAKTIQITP